MLTDTGVDTVIRCREIYGSSRQSTSDYTINQNQYYYVKVTRDESVGSFGSLRFQVWANSDLTDVVVDETLTLNKKSNFTKEYIVQSFNSAQAQVATGFVEYLFDDAGHGDIGESTDNFALGHPFQSHVYFDGYVNYAAYHQENNGTGGSIQIPPAEENDGVYKRYKRLISDYTIDGGEEFGLHYRMLQAYNAPYVFECDGSSSKIRLIYLQEDGNSQPWQYPNPGSVYDGSISAQYIHGNITQDRERKAWIAARTGLAASLYKLVIRRSAAYSTLNSWDSEIEVKNVNNDDGAIDAIGYYKDDVISIYTVDSTGALYANYYDISATSLQGEETILSSGLHSMYSFKAVLLRNQKILCVYRKSSDNKLYYRIRTSGVSGTWGTEEEISDTAYDADGGFALTADIGRDESAYLVYHNGTDFEYMDWNGSIWSDPATLVSSPSVYNAEAYVTSNFASELRMLFAWHEATSNHIHIEEIDFVEPDVTHNAGTAVTDTSVMLGDTSLGINRTNKDWMVTHNGVSLVMYLGRDGWMYGGVYTHATTTWTIPIQKMSTRRFVASYNNSALSIDSSGNVMYVEGGRDGPYALDQPYRILKSDYALDHGSFTLDLYNDWTDQDFTETPSTGFRGYKRISFDGNSSLWHFYYIDSEDFYIIQNRSGWKTAQHIWDASGSGNHAYTYGRKIGQEGSGDQSLWMIWGWSTLGAIPSPYGSIIHYNLNLIKLEPQNDGGGTYVAKDVQGNTLTLPLSDTDPDDWDCIQYYEGASGLTARANDTVYGLNEIVEPATPNGYWYHCTANGTSGGSPPSWNTGQKSTTTDGGVTWTCGGRVSGYNTQNWPAIDLIDASTPCIAYIEHADDNPIRGDNLCFSKWDGTNYNRVVIDSGSGVFGVGVAIVVGGEGIFVSAMKEVSGTPEVYVYESYDDGDTWSVNEIITTSSVDENMNVKLSVRSIGIQNLIWVQQHTNQYGIVMFDDILTDISTSPSSSPSASPSASPSISASPSVSTSPSASPSASPSISTSPSASPSSTPSASPSSTPSSSPSASPSISASPSTSISASPSTSPSSTPSPSPSASPSVSASPSISPSASPSASPSESPSTSPSASPSVSASPSTSISASPSSTPSTSPSASPSSTPSASPSASPSLSASPSATISASPSGSPSASISESPSATVEVSESPSASPSESPSVSASPSESAGPVLIGSYRPVYIKYDGKIVIADGGAPIKITLPDGIESSVRPVYIKYEDKVVIADGTPPIKITL
jgi:hypothetical protein